MNNIGQRIIANSDYSNLTKPIYPFFKPSVTARQYDPPSHYFSYPFPPPHPILLPPVYNNSYMHQTRHGLYNSLLKQEIQDLEDVLKERQTLRKKSTLAKVQSLTQLSRISDKKDDTSIEMLKIMNKQQDLLGDMVKTVQNLQPRLNYPPNSQEYGYYTPKAKQPTPIQTPKKEKVSREEILKDLDLESDNELDYLNNEKDAYLNNHLTQKEKSKLYDKIKSEKLKKERAEQKKSIKGIRKFRAFVWAVLFPIFTYSAMTNRKGTMKKIYVQDMETTILIFLEVAGTWVLKATREPIYSILSDSSLDFNVKSREFWFNKGKPDALNTKILKIHVRIKGILQGLINYTNKNDFPKPLILFLYKLVNNGAFIPQDYLVPYEKARLEFDRFGALCNQNEDKKGMIITFFFITRILVGMFLLKPYQHNLTIRNSNVLQ